MLGAIIGDIAGSFREFSKNKYEELGLLPDISELPDGTRYGLTDDSILTFATAHACMILNAAKRLKAVTAEDNYVISKQFSMGYLNFAGKYNDPIGGFGAGFLDWAIEDSPNANPNYTKLPYNSCGNGSAMRVSPVAYMPVSRNDKNNLAFQSAITTHNHPEGIKGAQATVAMIAMARDGVSMDGIVRSLKMQYLYYEPIEQYDHFDAICPETMRLVMHCLLTTDNFYDAVFKAVTLPNADSDTLGAIVGSIAEPLYGIPEDIKTKALGHLSEYYHLETLYYEFINEFHIK